MSGSAPRRSDEASPYETLRLMVRGSHLLQAINASVALGIPDLLKDGPMSSDAIADETATHAPSLYRLLRALAAAGLLTEDGDRRFALTPLGTLLRSDVPDSLSAMTRHVTSEPHVNTWANLVHSVRTGKPGRPHAPWDRQTFAEHPEYAAIFNRRMTEAAAQRAAAVKTGYEFSEITTLVDVGGGHGRLLASILQAYPRMRGILFDLPQVVDGATGLLEAAGVTDRCECVGGSFFDAVPEGGDAYILSVVIHDWDDQQATTILKNCRTAMGAAGRVLLVERVIAASGPSLEDALCDLEMLVGPGGRERTREEFRTLFAGVGFELSRIVPLTFSYNVVEGVPA
jgi:O-methyltransferase domain/Dimerisation domain